MTSIAITPETFGTFKMETAAGTDIVLELAADGWYVTRKPGMRKPDGHTEPQRLRGDFTRVDLYDVPEITPGEPVELLMLHSDGTVDRVHTAPITVIEEL